MTNLQFEHLQHYLKLSQPTTAQTHQWMTTSGGHVQRFSEFEESQISDASEGF